MGKNKRVAIAELVIAPSPPPDESTDSDFPRQWALVNDPIPVVPWAAHRSLIAAVSFSSNMAVLSVSAAVHGEWSTLIDGQTVRHAHVANRSMNQWAGCPD